MKKQLTWGILGAGWIAAAFTASALGSGKRIKAIASRDLKKAEAFVKKFGSGRYGNKRDQKLGRDAGDGGCYIEHAYGSYEELINDKEIDIIYIATPHSDHYKWAIECLNGGKNLLVEKAFTEDYKQAKKVVELAKKKNLFVMEAMWTRFLPHIIKIKELIKSGEIGDIVSIIADHSQFFKWNPKHRIFDKKQAGGALLDLGVYPVSFVYDILGYPKKIVALGTKAKTGVDDNISMIFEYKGSQAMLHTSSIARGSTSAEIIGTKGRIEIDTQFYRPTNFTVYYLDDSKIRYENKGEREDLFGFDGLYGMHFEIEEVENRILAGKKESDIMPLKHTLDVMKIMDEVRRQVGVEY